MFYIPSCPQTTSSVCPALADSELFATWPSAGGGGGRGDRGVQRYTGRRDRCQQFHFFWMAGLRNCKLFSIIERKLLALICLPSTFTFQEENCSGKEAFVIIEWCCRLPALGSSVSPLGVILFSCMYQPGIPGYTRLSFPPHGKG